MLYKLRYFPLLSFTRESDEKFDTALVYTKYEYIAISLLAYLSRKAGNRGKRVAWLWLMETKSDH